jgi:hypothetical protein
MANGEFHDPEQPFFLRRIRDPALEDPKTES